MKPGSLLHYNPTLVEEAVFLAAGSASESDRFHRERDRIYKIQNAAQREGAFQEFHHEWFLRLRLGEPVEQAAGEQPLVSSNVENCLVDRAPGKREEGAELFVRPEQKPGDTKRSTVSILLMPESFLAPSALLTFLRHELMHIADMLDPSFGYRPVLPPAEGGPTHDRLLKERYRVLWDATIDGRMVRRGWVPETVRSERLSEFCRTFPMFGDEAETFFSRFFDSESHSHSELVALVLDPRALAGIPQGAHPGTRCPLCGFQTYHFEAHPDQLTHEVIEQISEDFPLWRPSRGLCRQCADLYRARHLSLRAALLLPGNPYPGSVGS